MKIINTLKSIALKKSFLKNERGASLPMVLALGALITSATYMLLERSKGLNQQLGSISQSLSYKLMADKIRYILRDPKSCAATFGGQSFPGGTFNTVRFYDRSDTTAKDILSTCAGDANTCISIYSRGTVAFESMSLEQHPVNVADNGLVNLQFTKKTKATKSFGAENRTYVVKLPMKYSLDGGLIKSCVVVDHYDANDDGDLTDDGDYDLGENILEKFCNTINATLDDVGVAGDFTSYCKNITIGINQTKDAYNADPDDRVYGLKIDGIQQIETDGGVVSYVVDSSVNIGFVPTAADFTGQTGDQQKMDEGNLNVDGKINAGKLLVGNNNDASTSADAYINGRLISVDSQAQIGAEASQASTDLFLGPGRRLDATGEITFPSLSNTANLGSAPETYVTTGWVKTAIARNITPKDTGGFTAAVNAAIGLFDSEGTSADNAAEAEILKSICPKLTIQVRNGTDDQVVSINGSYVGGNCQFESPILNRRCDSSGNCSTVYTQRICLYGECRDTWPTKFRTINCIASTTHAQHYHYLDTNSTYNVRWCTGRRHLIGTQCCEYFLAD